MTHAVNLMDVQRLLPPRRLPLASVPVVAALVALGTFGASWWADQQSGALRHTRDLIKADMKRLQIVAGNAGQDRAVLLEALRRQAQAEEAWVHRLEGAEGEGPAPAGTAPPARASAAAWLRALGSTSGDGAWLTRVQVDARGHVSVDGRATASPALHAHLSRWREHPLLASVAMQSIDVRRDDAEGSELVFAIRPSLGATGPASPGGMPPAGAAMAAAPIMPTLPAGTANGPTALEAPR